MTFRASDIDKLLAYADHAHIVNGTRIVEQLRDYSTQLSTFMYYGNFFVGKLLEAKHLGRGTFTDVGTTYKLIRRDSLLRLMPALKPRDQPRVQRPLHGHGADHRRTPRRVSDHVPPAGRRQQGRQRQQRPRAGRGHADDCGSAARTGGEMSQDALLPHPVRGRRAPRSAVDDVVPVPLLEARRADRLRPRARRGLRRLHQQRGGQAPDRRRRLARFRGAARSRRRGARRRRDGSGVPAAGVRGLRVREQPVRTRVSGAVRRGARPAWHRPVRAGHAEHPAAELPLRLPRVL